MTEQKWDYCGEKEWYVPVPLCGDVGQPGSHVHDGFVADVVSFTIGIISIIPLNVAILPLHEQ